MARIRLMTVWGLLISVWVCKSLFAGDAVSTAAVGETAVSLSETAAAETVSEQPTEETTAAAYTGKSVPREIEDYVIGVVAAEMPVYFPSEALKAQAVAARTYACREYFADENTDLRSLGQAYLSAAELRGLWGADFDKNYAKIKQAVEDTRGELILYDNEPILAAFCSASGGMTENSENVWGSPLPYLRSVDSREDSRAPVYMQTISIGRDRLAALLGVRDVSDIRVTKRSPAGYALEVSAGGRVFEGSGVRQLLGLRSADMDISVQNDSVAFTSYGYGHGVGMSQYGACYMAEDGYGYRDILLHYYTDVYIGSCGVEEE